MDSRDDTQRFDAEPVLLDEMADEGGGDPLASFESEVEPARSPGRVLNRIAAALTPARHPRVPDAPPQDREVPAQGPDPLTLDQVLIRLGHVTWEEAVSVIDALCRVMNSSGSERVPEMSRVAITAFGTVVAGAGGTNRAAGPLLARMLHSLTASGKVPAPLRLFITRWVSASDGHAKSEFEEELAYFAHPDGQAVIQALYKRALATAVPIPQRPQTAATARQLRGLGGRRLQRVAAVIALGAGLTAMWFWLGDVLTLPQQTPTSLPVRSVSPVPTADEILLAGEEAAVVDAVDSTAAQVRPASNSRAASSLPAAARSTRTASRSPGDVPTPRPAGAPSDSVSSSAVRGSIPRSSAPPLKPVDPPASDVVTPLASAPTAEATLELAEWARTSGPQSSPLPIYSSADPDVTPPAFIYAQLPVQLVTGLRPAMNTIELIVSEAGTVERVRLVSTPKRLPDMMLLSGAKNWEFQPAMKNGESVKYRLELSWASGP